MPVSFLNPLLTWFLLLGSIPIILHLLLRSKPKKLLFPALRLIQQKRRQNVQRMRLRHIWLLLLRILVILIIVLALARPRVPAANYSPNWGELLTLGLLFLTACGAYYGVMWLWQRQRIPTQLLEKRRNLLRSSLGVGTLLLAILFVGWPFQQRIAAELAGAETPVDVHLPVAAVFLFDTSLSMQYRVENQTRLEQAREVAVKQVQNLPTGSQVAVADSGSLERMAFEADVSAALNRIAGLVPRPISFPLNERVRGALDLQEEDQARVLQEGAGVPESAQQDLFLREIYVFTDLAATGWWREETTLLREHLARVADVNLYLIDVGMTSPQNAGFSELQLTDAVISQGSTFRIQATVSEIGEEPHPLTVEFLLEDESGTLVRRGLQTATPRLGEEGRVEFAVPGLTGPVRQGELRVLSPDPLPFDNTLFFTMEVRPPMDVLVVSDKADDARYWREALAPAELEDKVRYRCTEIRSPQLSDENLAKYAAVCLINVADPASETWKKLETYVTNGGGLALFLGSDNLNPLSYNSAAAQAVLPAELRANLRFLPPEFLDLQNVTHPLLKKFADWGVGELTSVEILKYWQLELQATAMTIAPFTHERDWPAIVECKRERGRVLMFATSISRNGWNDLPAAGWSFVAFADQTVRYLTQRRQEVLNYVAGEEVLVELPSDEPLERYLLRNPQLQQTRGDVPEGRTSLSIGQVDQLGQYRVLSAAVDSRFERGFSVNPVPTERILTRLTEQDLTGLFGEKRYRLARNLEELDRTVQRGRLGKELFPWLLGCMLLVFVGEHLTANRFYDREPIS